MLRRAAAYLSQATCREMMYPLVRELAADGIPVTVTCRVLQLARQPYYRWLGNPVGDRDLEQAYLANAVFDAHRDDPEFGYRLLADEAREAGQQACDRTVWRICAANRWWSSFAAKKGRNGKRPGPAVHDDLVDVSSVPMRRPAVANRHHRHRTSEESCICARSRTCSPAGSSATPSLIG